MNFIQKNYETLLTKMEIAHIHEDNRKDFDELEDALLDIVAPTEAADTKKAGAKG